MSTSAYADLAAAARLFADAMEKMDGAATPGGDGAVSVKDAAKALGISKAHLYEQARAGALKVLRIGKAVRIPASELELFRRRRLR